MLYKFKAKIHTGTASITMEGDILGDTNLDASETLKSNLAKAFNVDTSKIDIIHMLPKRGRK